MRILDPSGCHLWTLKTNAGVWAQGYLGVQVRVLQVHKTIPSHDWGKLATS